MLLKTRVKQKAKQEAKQRSPDVFIRKFKKIPNNKIDFASNLYIRSGGSMKPFLMYDYQKKILKSIEENQYTFVFKVRQTGLSELALLDLNYDALVNPAFSGTFISWRYAIEVRAAGLRYAQLAKQVEEVYGVPLEINNTYSQKYRDGGTVNFRSGLNPDNAVGEPSVCKIVYDEGKKYPLLQIIPNANATMEMLGDRARSIIISTFGAITDDYGQILLNNNPFDLIELVEKIRDWKNNPDISPYQEFKDNKDYKKIIIYWKAHPIYGKEDNYITKKINNSPASEDDILREHDLLIKGGADNEFDFQLVEKAFILEELDDWKDDIDENALYRIGIDTAGSGDDYFVCTVFKETENDIRLVWLYRNRTNTTQVHLAELSQIIRKYKPYQVSIESNHHGGQTYKELLQDAFPSENIIGVNTTNTRKGAMVRLIKYLFECDRLLMPNDKTTKNEFLSFQKDGQKYSAPPGKHDDIVMATLIALHDVRDV